ncbi:MAG: TrkH family potassium uptake protein [Synergistaceae bacterium]|nr:TrkH family potassium uptake protein [Synergistaceae bacterium]
MNWFLVAKFLSFITGIVSISMMLPIMWGHFDGSGEVRSLVISMLLGLIFSGLLFTAGRHYTNYKNIKIRDAFAVVSLSWVFASVIGALPYYINGMVPTFTDAFFEAMSGFTTTGASILTDIEAHPKSLLFWRGLTHWLGGMGIIVLSLAILPFVGVGGLNLFKAEVPGFGLEKITPRLHQMALRLWCIYFALTAAQVFFLLLGGVNLFEALTHSFSTIATGGLSPLNKSISHYNSPYIEWVTTFFMFFSGVNFVLHYRFLLRQSDVYCGDEEFRLYASIVFFSILFTSAVLLFRGYCDSIEEAIRYSAFQVVSIITSTGFYTTDYELWPVSIHFLFIFLMFAGGCTGSTAGGIKSLRILALARHVKRGLDLCLHPQGMFSIKIRGKTARKDAVASVTAFFILYLLVFISGVLFMGALGLDFVTAVSSAAASIGNTGPGFGTVGPTDNFFHIPAAGKWVLSFLMLMGRLEIYTVILLFVPETWRR